MVRHVGSRLQCVDSRVSLHLQRICKRDAGVRIAGHGSEPCRRGNSACSFAGTLVPRSDVCAFDYTIRTTAGSCIYADGMISGIAYQAPEEKPRLVRDLGASRFLLPP